MLFSHETKLSQASNKALKSLISFAGTGKAGPLA
jgi:hypothetical protein